MGVFGWQVNHGTETAFSRADHRHDVHLGQEAAADPTKVERFVRVKWLKTIPVSEAFREKGFFGNQNSAAKPRAKSWQHTVERLKQRFEVAD